jgi:two-component system phosphate regulon sensor histidine kinase PhoR
LKLEVDKATADIMKTNVDLEAALKIKDEFLQIASHQLRTPVSVMYGVMDTFKAAGDDMDEAQRKQFINSAFQKSKKLGQVVDDVLSATEMNAPDFNIGSTAKPMNLREMAQKAVEFHKEEADNHKLALTLEAEEPGPAVKASEAFLPQAISNLVDNSIKYTPEGGSITVKAYTEGDMAVLAVTDTGMGVPPDDLGKLWDKFKRGKNAKNMHTDGSGLGLFIIKKIVEGHEGGSVFAQSELGKGSTFGFKLPAIKNNMKDY